MSSGKKLIDDLGCEKGITLNSQIVDLLSILDEDISPEEQDKKIIEYIENLRKMQEEYNKAKQQGESAKYQFVIGKVIDSLNNIPAEKKEELKKLYIESLGDLSIYDSEKMQQKLIERGFDQTLHELVLKQAKNLDFEAKDGILDMTPEKVRSLYNHMFPSGEKPRYDRMTIDNAGKYSSYVCNDGKTYADERLDKMIKFAERHKMKSKVNTVMFYADFPKNLEALWEKEASEQGLSEEEKHQYVRKKMRETLIGYVEHLGQNYGDRIDSLDIFNELIYDPVMLEEREIYEEENTYHPREKGWQKYLNLEDLCEMALLARKLMPQVSFAYNDMNWVNPDKRKKMIQIIKKIQNIEEMYRQEGRLGEDERLIDVIGFEGHLTTGDNPKDIEDAFSEVEQEIGLSIEVTELDVARIGDNPLSQEEIEKQNRIIETFAKLEKEGKIKQLTVWSISDGMSFMNDKCQKIVYASVILDENCNEKEYEPEKDVKLQNFNYHTHTSLCGHAYGQIEEYIQKAIEGGIVELGFSDHMPNPFGKGDPRQSMSLEQFQNEYLPILQKLKEKYRGQIGIKIGLECEYYGEEGEQESPIKEFRQKTEDKLDYMILGQHFALKRDENGKLKRPPEISPKTSAQYPLDYAMTVVEAIKSGKFAYVAHPDIFLEGRDGVPEEERALYYENVKKAAQMICEAASKYGIPLEVNLGSISATEAGIKGRMKDGSYAYPVPEFWKIAQEYGCKVLIGIDAHSPEALREKDSEIIAKKLLKDNGIRLNYIDSYEQLKIRQNHLRGSGNTLINSLGRQVTEEMSDPVITDETEAHESGDIEKLESKNKKME